LVSTGTFSQALKSSPNVTMHESKGKFTPSTTTAAAVIARVLSSCGSTPVLAGAKLHELSALAERDGRLVEAIDYASVSVEIGRELEINLTTILGLLSRGRLLFKVALYDQAIADHREALTRAESDRSLPTAHLSHIRYIASSYLGASLWRSGDLSSAAQELTRTTTFARERFGMGSAEALKSLIELIFLGLETREPEGTLMNRIETLIRESRCGPEMPPTLSAQALELGRALHHHGLWDAASYTLDWTRSIASSSEQKTEALLALANIASYKSQTAAMLHFVQEAENLWWDVAPRPYLERHIANLRALAALDQGSIEAYQEHIARAQELDQNEDPSIEERIQLHFTRAQALRYSGLEHEAQAEVARAHALVNRALVNPLTRFNTFLQQGFCEHKQGKHFESNRLVDAALLIALHELDHNKVLEARARTLRALNHLALFASGDESSTSPTTFLTRALADGETALELLSQGGLDPYSRKVLLRLLQEVADHLGLAAKRSRYGRQLEILEAEYPAPPG